MAYVPANISFEDNYQELRLGGQVPFSGLNLRDMDTSIGDGQSPYMINVNLDDGGKPTKRRGQESVFASKGSGGINGLYKETYKECIVYAWGTGLYTYKDGTETQIKSGLANAQGYFYTFNDVLFYKNGTDFLKWDGSTVSNVLDNAYIPTITLGRAPTGGGTANEGRNLIQPGFRDSFTSDGTATYKLSFSGLDAKTSSTPVTAIVNGITYTEDAANTYFTVDRTNGTVTFKTGYVPATVPSAVNNVVITAYKTIAGDKEKIIKAVRCTLFGGGTNDSRIFCCGNDDYKNLYYYTGLTGNTNSDASYYPEFNFNRIGSDNKRISGWSYLYSNLLALKEDGIYMIKYSTNGTTVSFPVSIMNRQVGCDMPDSIQIIKNFPVFANTQSGIWTIVGTLIESEKNVEPISSLINVASNKAGIPGMLDNDIDLLQAATSFNDGLKYYLCVGSNCYVWDFDKSPFNNGLTTAAQSSLIWYYYTNINAKAWAWVDREVYYGDRSIGQLARFQDNKNDFGNSINAVWRSKLFNFGIPDLLKTISEVWFTTRAGKYNTLSIKYYSDDREIADTARVVTNSFSLIEFSLIGFTVKVSKFAPTIKRKPKIKKVIYFQLEYLNNVVNESLSLLDIVIRYMVNNKVKTR